MLPSLLAYRDAAERLRRNVGLTTQDLDAQRLGRFRELVRHAQQHSACYATILRERGIRAETCVPGDFPVLTKRLLREHFDAIATDARITHAAISEFLADSPDPGELYLDEYVVLHTSGTSGEVGCVVYSGADWARGMAGMARVSVPDPRRIAFVGATGGHHAGVSFALAARLLPRSAVEVLTIDIHRPIGDMIRELHAFQPDVLAGYPSGTRWLAEAQRDGRLRIRPRSIQCSGEALRPDEQASFEAAFGCPCVNVYASTETMLIGVARTGDPAMTLLDDDLIIEPAGDHVLVTNLNSRALPLIRYRLDDAVRLTGRPAPSGPYRTIEPVVGRSEGGPTFRTAEGTLETLSAHVINEIFVPGVARFQMRVADEHTFRFLVCLDPGAGGSSGAGAGPGSRAVALTRARLQAILEEKGLGNVRFTVEVTGELPVDPASGKVRLIVPPTRR